MTIDRKTALRAAIMLGLASTSFALYWAGTSAGPEIQAALLVLMMAIAAIAVANR